MNFRKLINLFEAAPAAPPISAREADMQRRMAATRKTAAAVAPGTTQTSTGPSGASMTISKSGGTQPAQAQTATPTQTSDQVATAALNKPAGPQTNAMGVAAQANVPTFGAPTPGTAKPAGQAAPAASPAAPSAGNEQLKTNIAAGSPATPAPAPAANNQSSGYTAQSQAQKPATPAPAQPAATQTATASPSGGGAVAAFGQTAMANAPGSTTTPAPTPTATADVSGATKGIPAAFGQMAEDELEEELDPADVRRSIPRAQSSGTITKQQEKLPSIFDVERANKEEIYQGTPNPYNDTTITKDKGSKSVNTVADFEESIDYELAEMMRLSGIPLNEKAVSKQQQKFMGMVHAMQKGEKIKGASSELKKAAKGMSKKDAKDFASTKHKGLPQKVTEGIMLDEGGSTLNHIANRFKHEFKMFMQSGDMADNLFDALYDYYNDTGEMPYGVAKARDGDPSEWVAERFYADMGGGMSEAVVVEEPVMDDPLNELARLAGLQTTEGVLDTVQTAVDKFTLPKDAHAAYNAYKERQAEKQSGSAYKDQAGTTYDRFGNPKDMPGIRAQDLFDPNPNRDRDMYRMRQDQALKNMQNESVDLTECGDMDQENSMNVSTNMSSDGTKNVTISAQGDKADELLQMLKMAGMRPHDDHDHTGISEPEVIMIGDNDEMMDEERETEYSNTPEEEYQSIDSIIHQGNDLNREKRQYAGKPRLGDNPMAESVLDEEMSALLDSILIKEFDDITDREKPYKDAKTGRMITPPKGLSISEPVYPAAKAPKIEPRPDITDREKPYRDPKTGRMVTPPKGLSISEPVYPAAKTPGAK